MSSVVNDLIPLLESRYKANLTFQEIRKGAQALSQTYVQGRDRMRQHDWGAGKRAAFCLYYAALHGLVIEHLISELELGKPQRIIDIGCGTGLPGLVWQRLARTNASILGFEPSKWSAEEATWLYRSAKVQGQVQQKNCDALRNISLKSTDAILLAYVINELPDETRHEFLHTLQKSATSGCTIFIVEPIAQITKHWWDEWVLALGATTGEMKKRVILPESIKLFDKASKLDHSTLKARWMVVA